MKFTLPVEFAILFMLVFARTGALIMTMPMLGERSIPTRIRLVLALLLSLIIVGLIRNSYGRIADDPSALFGLMFAEILAGLGLGAAIRFLTVSADIASHVISQSFGLSLAEIFNPSIETQSTTIGIFLTMLLVVTMFTLDLHQVLISGIVGSYRVMPPGLFYPLGDFSRLGIQMVSQSFVIALQIAAPFILFGILFNLGLGFLSRFVPQVQVVFLATPLSIFAGLLMLSVLLGTIVERLVQDFSNHLAALGGG